MLFKTTTLNKQDDEKLRLIY